jgi:hypothetical protein
MIAARASDKVYWHNYVEFYERFFHGRSFASIAEIGILRGDSIRWLIDRFPDARIYAADIVSTQPSWPANDRVTYVQMDQGDDRQVERFFSMADFDLIIEDGSHVPEHQLHCLLLGMRHLRPSGHYVLEDVHTSHPRHPGNPPGLGNALSILLAIDHYRRIGVEIDSARAALIAHDSMLTPAEVLDLASTISRVHLYRRTNLPDHCFRCGARDFNFSQYRCRCGVEIFSDTDSMSFVIEKAPMDGPTP